MTKTGPYYSEWYGVDICEQCKKELSHADLFYSSGVCPYCGHSDEGTITPYKTRVQREVYNKHHFLFGLISVRKLIRVEHK